MSNAGVTPVKSSPTNCKSKGVYSVGFLCTTFFRKIQVESSDEYIRAKNSMHCDVHAEIRIIKSKNMWLSCYTNKFKSHVNSLVEVYTNIGTAIKVNTHNFQEMKVDEWLGKICEQHTSSTKCK